MYLHHHNDWPNFKRDNELLLPYVSSVCDLQGSLIGRVEAMALELREAAVLDTLIEDIVKSNEIEGEILNPEEVRSSVAKRLGIEIAGLPKASRHLDGVVEMMMDATYNYQKELFKDSLYDNHAALFPTGRNGMHKITDGKWRSDEQEPMQGFFGAIDRETVHFVAPDGH